jgi:hypothetical protein
MGQIGESLILDVRPRRESEGLRSREFRKIASRNLAAAEFGGRRRLSAESHRV